MKALAPFLIALALCAAPSSLAAPELDELPTGKEREELIALLRGICEENGKLKPSAVVQAGELEGTIDCRGLTRSSASRLART
jgi:hypothetical protein